MNLVKGEWPGTAVTGLVKDDAVRRCDNCRFYNVGNCNEEHLVADPENKDLLNEDGKSIKVKPFWCSNFFQIRKDGLTYLDVNRSLLVERLIGVIGSLS